MLKIGDYIKCTCSLDCKSYGPITEIHFVGVRFDDLSMNRLNIGTIINIGTINYESYYKHENFETVKEYLGIKDEI